MAEPKVKPVKKAPVQQPLFTIPDLSCGTPEAQMQLALFMQSQTPEQVQTIKNFLMNLRSGAAISCGYKRSIHYMMEWFKNVPTTVKLT